MNDATLPYALRLLAAVAEDLYIFARESIQKKFARSPYRQTTRALTLPPMLPAHTEAASEDEEVICEGPATFRSTGELLEASVRRPEKNTVMYTGGTHIPLYLHPTVELDGIIEHIPYGAMVMVLETRGRWSHVGYRNATGWVLRDELIDQAAHVYPDFTIGEKNMSDDPNTLKVRAFIEDEFGGGTAELPLQSGEYALYRLYRKGKRVVWPDVRPRVTGSWHELLKGTQDIHMGIAAKAGSIMEYTQNDGEGHAAYVESVLSDETISISEANFPDSGIYNERVLTKEEWRELHPVFIEVA